MCALRHAVELLPAEPFQRVLERTHTPRLEEPQPSPRPRCVTGAPDRSNAQVRRRTRASSASSRALPLSENASVLEHDGIARFFDRLRWLRLWHARSPSPAAPPMQLRTTHMCAWQAQPAKGSDRSSARPTYPRGSWAPELRAHDTRDACARAVRAMRRRRNDRAAYPLRRVVTCPRTTDARHASGPES